MRMTLGASTCMFKTRSLNLDAKQAGEGTLAQRSDSFQRHERSFSLR